MDASVLMNFMLTDDGSTLLAVRQANDGSLELITTPVTILHNTPDNYLQALKTQNSDVILNQIKLNNMPPNNTQQPNLTSIEVIDLESQDFQLENEKESESADITTNLLYKNADFNSSNAEGATEVLASGEEQPLEKSQLTSAKEVSSKDVSPQKNSPPSKKDARKSLGRPRKSKTTDEEQACFKCDVCGQQFKKQYLMQKHMHEHAQEKPHHCPKCPASFNVPTNFTLHMAIHNIGEPKCPECGRKFARMASLKSHMLVHEVDENLYCTECDDVFEAKTQLDAHMKLHNEKWSADDYRKCKLCRKQFTQPVLYRQHLRDHYKLQTKCTRQTKRGIRSGTVYKCRICLKAFEKPSQLVRHLRVHTGEKPYKCNLCNRSFTQKGSVRIHMWQHNGIRPYSCSFCHAKFSQKGNLNAHVQRVHSAQEGSPMYRCTQCPCIFKKLGSLNGHMKRAHSGSGVGSGGDGEKKRDTAEEPDKSGEEEQPSEEDIRATVDNVMHQLADLKSCVEKSRLARRPDDEGEEEEVAAGIADDEDIPRLNEESASRSNGSGMDQTSSGLPTNFENGFVVTDDNEQTAVVTLLDKVANDAEGKYIKIKQRFVNNSRLYECSFCDKTFKKPSDLMRHLRIHTHEKPFKCYICSRSFTLKSTMLSHERTHTNVRRFSCHLCKTYFITENSLEAHVKKVHHGKKCSMCGEQFASLEELKDHSAARHVVRKSQQGGGSKSKRRKNQFGPEIQNLVPKVVLKEPLVLTEVSNGLLHAQPKYRNDLAHGKGRPHKCPDCPAAFMKMSHLKQHHLKHTGERPHVCLLCDRKFTTGSALKAHRRIHDLLRPYKCSICNRNFSTLSSMKRHHITHSNKRPYMCPYCNKTFKTTVNCRKHMKIHKQEIALQQLEQHKKQKQSSNLSTHYVESTTITKPIIIDAQDITFQPMANNLTQDINKQLESFSPSTQNIHVTQQTIPVVENPNINTTQTLHADETGTVTLPNFTGNQTLTPENIRQIEETLNQQLFSIGMNLATNNTVTQMEERNNTLETQDQPILSIIYDDRKSMESTVNTPVNTNVFSSQLDTFDINQISLQTAAEIDMAQANLANMASILPKSIQEDQCYNSQLINDDFEMNAVLRQHNFNKDNQMFNNSTIKNFEKQQILDEENRILIKETNLQCHMCNTQGYNADGLKEHLKTHQGNREFECTHCQSKFCTSGGLNRHIKIHESQETYKCYECNKEFPTSLQLREHIKDTVKTELELKNSKGADDIKSNNEPKNGDEIVNKKYNKCKYCPKTFRKPSDLVRHIRTHTGERPYRCRYCDKSFAVKCTLDSHLKIHGGEKSFHCHVCNSMLTTKGSLKVHMRLHTGAKPFKCPMCDMKFRTSGHRKVHLISHTREHNSSSTRRTKKHPSIVALAAEVNKLEQSKDEQIVQIVHAETTPPPIVTQPVNIQAMDDNENLNNIAINSSSDQITFDSDGNVLNDASELLTLDENNQLVANLEFLLANGLVTIQTDETAMPSQLPLSSTNVVQSNYITTNVVDKVQDQAIGPQVIYTTQIVDTDPAMTNTNNLQLNNCMVLQLEDIDSTVPINSDDGILKSVKTPSNATRRECDICGKGFSKPCQVERHKRTHTGERPFKCEICHKSFAQKSTLQMHQKHHTGDRPYPCHYCERAFTQSGNLQTHLKRVHKMESAATKRMPKDQQFINYDSKLLQQSIEDARILNFDDISIVELLK